jgi:imidazole glycerol phosphate synthase subunit HisF
MTVLVGVSARITIAEIEREDLTAVFHGMGEVFTELEDTRSEILDHAVSVDLGARSLEIEVTAEGETPEAADLAGRAAVLVAMLKTGGRPAGGIDTIQEWMNLSTEGVAELLPTVVDEELNAAGFEVSSHRLVAA